jgi:hypothetical protein
MMIYIVIASTAFSIALIGLLWRGDPKRRRVAGLPKLTDTSNKRRLMTAALLLPGVALAAAGDSAAFMIWFGSCAVGGWLIAQLDTKAAD